MSADFDRRTQAAYAALEDRVLDRDQVGASTVAYDLLKAGRPATEILLEKDRLGG